MLEVLQAAARRVSREPRASIGAAALLAIAAGAVLALFGPVYSLAISPLPFSQPTRLMYVGAPVFDIFNATFPERGRLGRAFSGIAAYWGSGPDWLENGRTITTITVTRDFFATLGVPLRRGSLPADTNGVAYAAVSAALSRTIARRGGTVIGGELILASGRYRIAAVAPPGFAFPYGAQVWELARGSGPLPDGTGRRSFVTIGRLRRGVERASAAALLAVLNKKRSFLVRGSGGPAIEPLREYLRGGQRASLWGLWAAAFACLLLACAGAGSLLLARNLRLQHETAVRLALGASGRRLAAEALIEALFLAIGGVLAGAGAASIARMPLAALVQRRMGVAAPAAGPGMLEIVALAAGLAVTVAAMVGLAPVLGLTKSDPVGALQRSPGQSRQRAWLTGQEWLTTLEMGLALTLLASTAALSAGALAQDRAPLGFAPNGVAVISLSVPPLPATIDAVAAANAALPHPDVGTLRRLLIAEEAERARDVPIYEGATKSVARLPGVEQVGAMVPAPLFPETARINQSFTLVDPRVHGWRDAVYGYEREASANAFTLLRVPLLRGRTFSRADTAAAEAAWEKGMESASVAGIAPVPAVINLALARALWPGGGALGGVFYEPQALRVIGVVGNVRESAARLKPVPTAYQVALPNLDINLLVRLRPSADFAAFSRSSVHALHRLSPLSAPAHVISLAAQIRQATAGARLLLRLLAAFAAFGTVVGCLGVYASCRQAAAARRREFAVRLALGATPHVILRAFAWRAARMVLVAAPAAWAGSWLLLRAVQHLTPQRPSGTPWFAGAAVLLVALAAVMGLAPARRVASAEPGPALRAE